MMYTTWMRYDLGDEGREGLGCFGEGGRARERESEREGEGVRERGKLRHTEREGEGEKVFFAKMDTMYTQHQVRARGAACSSSSLCSSVGGKEGVGTNMCMEDI